MLPTDTPTAPGADPTTLDEALIEIAGLRLQLAAAIDELDTVRTDLAVTTMERDRAMNEAVSLRG